MKKCFDAKYSVTIRMIVHQDFMNYKSGIYCYKSGGPLGGHAIRGVGYGTSPMFHVICANSWGTSWGDKGYFKIEGKEACKIRMTPGDAWSAKDFLK
jgi:C1A family cysteine protease